MIKLLFAPALVLLLARLCGLQPNANLVVVVESAIPAILLVIAYSGQYKLDVEFANTAVFATFFFSMLPLPFWAYVARF